MGCYIWINNKFYLLSWRLMVKNAKKMGVKVKLGTIMARRKMSLRELSERVGVTVANLSVLKSGRGRAIRFSTLEAICHELHCQPGDILEYTEEN